MIVLCEELKRAGSAVGHLIPGERMLWLEGGIPMNIYDNLQEQNMRGDTAGLGPSEQYGKIRVRGKFEYGGQYGHLGMYEYRITPSEMQLLPWSPQP